MAVGWEQGICQAVILTGAAALLLIRQPWAQQCLLLYRPSLRGTQSFMTILYLLKKQKSTLLSHSLCSEPAL